jgi:HEPN domain-containing protein
VDKGVTTIVVKQWLEKADHDRELVRRDLAQDEPLSDILLFHCQQAAEKYLKAFLVSRGQKPPRTHEIEELVYLCVSFEPGFSAFEDVFYLTNYAVDMRYPDDFSMPPVEQVQKSMDDVDRLRSFVMGIL